ncbi:MAG: ABC transporter substrate-binding protein [Bdellovibrionales bacterium]|nr:ABC transporter substrate-binding protein [Bdellovibrionales bacterium]
MQSHILESLLKRNPETYEWESSLAKEWEQSPDGRTFLFRLYKGLKWSDGKPLTAQDVKFSLEAYKNPAYEGIRHISVLENIKGVKIIDDHTIQFITKKPHFKNFSIVSKMLILPEHIYRVPEYHSLSKMDKNPSKAKNIKPHLNRIIVGSGPYKFLQYQQGKILVLTRNQTWFGRKIPSNKGQWNFKNIAFRFVSSRIDSFLRMQKGELDFVGLSAGEFVRDTFKAQKGVEIEKIKYALQQSYSSYIGWNLKNPLFQDQRTRRALAHLLNRQFINEKLGFNLNKLSTGPWTSWSEYADSSVKPLLFNPKKASMLLQAAGWEDTNKDGILEKDFNGRRRDFSFTVIAVNESSNLEKYLTIFQEDLKRAGIRLSIQFLGMTSMLAVFDERKFDAIFFGDGFDVDIDPRPWHSASIKKGRYNYIGYSNSKVDRLIEEAEQQFDRKKRIKILKEAYRLIANEVPCLFVFDYPYRFYAINKRIHTPKPSFKYNLGMSFWSIKKIKPEN